MTDAPCGWDAEPCEDCCTAAQQSSLWPILSGMAVNFLWKATGKQYGLCERTYRPCREDCGSYWGSLPFPARVNGQWVNLTCGCLRGCSCSNADFVNIPNTDSVVAVNIGGEALAPTGNVVVYNRQFVARVDGFLWPTCQNLNAPLGEPDTWSITVMEGKPVPDGGEWIAGVLACELSKACANDSTCRLPRRVQTITREGVTVGFQDRFETLADLRTGVWEVDAWIESNRTTRWRDAAIVSVDRPRARTVTWA